MRREDWSEVPRSYHGGECHLESEGRRDHQHWEFIHLWKPKTTTHVARTCMLLLDVQAWS